MDCSNGLVIWVLTQILKFDRNVSRGITWRVLSIYRSDFPWMRFRGRHFIYMIKHTCRLFLIRTFELYAIRLFSHFKTLCIICLCENVYKGHTNGMHYTLWRQWCYTDPTQRKTMSDYYVNVTWYTEFISGGISQNYSRKSACVILSTIILSISYHKVFIDIAFFWNINYWQHKAQGIGCLLWVLSLVKFCPNHCSVANNKRVILDRGITALTCIYTYISGKSSGGYIPL